MEDGSPAPAAGVPRPVPTAEAADRTARRQRLAVYGIAEDGRGNILLTRAASYLTVGGDWFLPGGGVDHGEEPADALRREVEEETGLEVDIGELLGVLSDLFTLPDGVSLHTVRIIYHIASYAGEVRDEVDGSTDAARWVPLEEAFELPLRSYVRRALTELR